MAVLWQLGVEFVQGYFVSSPEEVVLGAWGGEWGEGVVIGGRG